MTLGDERPLSDLVGERVPAPVYDNGVVHVLEAQCPTCIFRPGNLMRLAPGRVAEMVHDAKAGESVIPCHSTLYGQSVQQAVCRGYWDRHARDVVTLRLAQAVGIVRFVTA